jgi:anti-anti-sigma regulatory factor
MGTTMQHRDMRGSRSSGWMIVGLCGACLLLGPVLSSTVPRFVLGGLFLNFGASFLTSATTVAMTPSEYFVLWLTAGTYVGLGGMAGLAVGFVFTCLNFVVEQSQLEAAELVESVERGKPQLVPANDPTDGSVPVRKQNIAIALKGTLFFATTHHLTDELLRSVERFGPGSSGIVLLNFSKVQSVDVSAIFTIKQLSEQLAARGWELKCSGLRSRLASRFASAGIVIVAAAVSVGASPKPRSAPLSPVEPQPPGASPMRGPGLSALAASLGSAAAGAGRVLPPSLQPVPKPPVRGTGSGLRAEQQQQQHQDSPAQALGSLPPPGGSSSSSAVCADDEDPFHELHLPHRPFATKLGCGGGSLGLRSNRTVTRLPLSVNLSALESPLERHCWMRRTSPSSGAVAARPSGCSIESSTPLWCAIVSKTAWQPSTSACTAKGWKTRSRRPASIRSKSGGG